MSQPKILLVDDSINVLKALRRTFAQENYRILTASSGDDARAILAAESIDIIISDEHMPGMSGSELLSLVHDQYPDVVRMMLTGDTDIEVAKRAVNEGAIFRFFTKPWVDYEVLVGVQRAWRMKQLEIENQQLRVSVKKQDRLLKDLEAEYPGIAERKLAPDGAIIID